FLRAAEIFICTKIIQVCRASGNGRFFVPLSGASRQLLLRFAAFCCGHKCPCKNRRAAPAAPSLLHPLDALGAAALWTPYPTAATRAEPWTQMRKAASGVWVEKPVTTRQMSCASLFPDAIRPALRFCMRSLRARPHPTPRTKKNRYTKSPHKQSKHTLHTSTQSNEKKAKTKK